VQKNRMSTENLKKIFKELVRAKYINHYQHQCLQPVARLSVKLLSILDTPTGIQDKVPGWC